MESVGVVTVAVGERYQAFLPEWAHAVAALERQPDQTVVVADHMPQETIEQLDGLLDGWQLILSTRTWECHPQVLANDGIAALQTDWVCKLDADDLILPHAFNILDGFEADVCAFGLSVNGEKNHLPNNLDTHAIRNTPNNLLYAASPFRRSVWEHTGGFRDVRYDDWAFWREAAASGARFQASGTIDYIYRLHEFNASKQCDHEAERMKVLGLVF